jgi:hypothetical protein
MSRYNERYEPRSNFGSSTRRIAVASILAALSIAAASGLIISGVHAAQALNNVQIFVQPQNSSDDYFILSVYNSSGQLVVQSNSQFPAFGAELPSDTYLFTVVAEQPGYYPPPVPLGMKTGAGQVGAPVASQIPVPIYYTGAVEYGYVVEHITGDATIQLQTQNVSTISTTDVNVQVNYKNGTGASGAEVYASVVGGWYWWGDSTKNLKMWAQTDDSGKAVLTVPSLPVEITAWAWVPVDLPKNTTTVQVTVGGEPVNVTVYWEPTYVGLAGSALVIPPQSSVTITLHIQQPNYWYEVGQAQSVQMQTPVGIGTASSAPSAVPVSVYNDMLAAQGGQNTPLPGLQAQTPGTGSTETASPSYPIVLVALGGALLLVSASMMMILLRRH